jgi:hypothetical protein
MSAARAIRQDETVATTAAEIDLTILDEINAGIVEWETSGNPARQAMAARLREDRALAGYVAGVANTRGHSFDDEFRTRRRDRFICKCLEMQASSTLRRELSNYQETSWPRDRGKANPYPQSDMRHYYFEILSARDHVPTVNWINKIWKRNRGLSSKVSL